METENKIATSTQKKAWARPEIIFIAQGDVEHTKMRTVAREKTFVISNPPFAGFHSIIFDNTTKIVPDAITRMDYLS